MQKHIRYEVEIIADEAVAPSLAQLHGFFLEAIRAAEKTTADKLEEQPRRGRPKKFDPLQQITPPAASKRPEEQLFTIRRTATPLDVYLGELDEAVEKLKAQQPAAHPQKPENPDPFSAYSSPLMWYPSPSPTCSSREPSCVPESQSAISDIDETA